MTIRRKKLGLGDAKSPTSSRPCIYRAELALPYATYPEPMPIQVGTHQQKERFLMEKDAQAFAGFLMGNVISTFSVRQVYDRFLYNRRAGYNEPLEISVGNIHEQSECIRERPQGSERRPEGGAKATANSICRIRQFNNFIGVAINSFIFCRHEGAVMYCSFFVPEWRSL